MARISFKNLRDYEFVLRAYQAAAQDGKMLEDAVKAGAKIVADKIRDNLESMPTERYRKLLPGETFSGLPKGQKKDLLDSFGLTPIARDKNGFVNTKAGFDGYGSYPTAAYPGGVPNQLLARAVESGSSVREKHPFVRPAVNATRKAAVDAMEKVITAETEKLFTK